MTESRSDPDFLQKPIAPDHGGEFRPQHLDRDLAIVLDVVSQENRSHASLSQLPLDAVVVGECSGQFSVDGQWSMVGGQWSWVVSRGSTIAHRLPTAESRTASPAAPPSIGILLAPE